MNTHIPAPIQWAGGKGKHLQFILSHLADFSCDIFVDAFGGSGGVILNRKRAPIEVYNDANGYLTNMYRVLQDKAAFERLREMLAFTTYNRREYARALQYRKEHPIIKNIDVMAAWAIFASYNQGFGGIADALGNWGRAMSTTNGRARVISSWERRVELLGEYHSRIKDWQIDNRDAVDVALNFDTDKTLTYFDPPYMHSTRTCRSMYAHEMDDAMHARLVETAKEMSGGVAISGYANPLYDSLLDDSDWRRVDLHTRLAMGNA